MLRKSGELFALISAVLCIVTIIAWIRSRSHTDVILLPVALHQTIGAATYRGGLLFAQCDLTFDGETRIDGSSDAVMIDHLSVNEFAKFHDTIFDPTAEKFSFAGFKTAVGTTTITPSLTAKYSALMLPAWSLVLALAILPMGIGKAAWVRFRRKRKGLCIACGYDMRASEGRCPECGREKPVVFHPAES